MESTNKEKLGFYVVSSIDGIRIEDMSNKFLKTLFKQYSKRPVSKYGPFSEIYNECFSRRLSMYKELRTRKILEHTLPQYEECAHLFDIQ